MNLLFSDENPQFDDSTMQSLFEEFLQEHPELVSVDEGILKAYIQKLQTDGELKANSQDQDAFFAFHLSPENASDLGLKTWNAFGEWLRNRQENH